LASGMIRLGVIVAYARAKYGEEPTLEQYAEFLNWVSLMGFDGFELAAFSRDHFHSQFRDKLRLNDIRQKYQSLGLECNAFEAGFLRSMMVDSSRDVRRQLVEDFENVVETAGAIDAPLVYGHPAIHPSWKVEWRRLYDEFSPPISVVVPTKFSWKRAWEDYVELVGELTDLAGEAGLRFALEIRPFAMVTTSDSMIRLAEAVGSNNLGAVFDTGHLFVQKEILPVAIEKLGDKVFLVHLADNDGLTDYHWAPGRGKIHWESVIQTIEKTDYRGYANMDVAGGDEDIESETKLGLEYIRKILSQTSDL